MTEAARSKRRIPGKLRLASARPLGGLYVYGIVRAGTPMHGASLEAAGRRAELGTVVCRDLAAVVSAICFDAAERAPTRESVLMHERVHQWLTKDHTVLPMAFGTVFDDRHELRSFLASAYDAFDQALTTLEGKVEYGLQVRYARGFSPAELEAGDRELRRLRDEIVRTADHAARLEYGRRIEAARRARAEGYGRKVLAALRGCLTAGRLKEPLGDAMLMNGALLVPRENAGELARKVHALAARDEALIFRLSGPWPAYDFVTIRLKLESMGGGP